MKKILKISVAVLLVVIMISSLASCTCVCSREPELVTNQFGETLYRYMPAYLTYNYNGQNIHEQLPEEKSLALQGFFNQKEELEEKPDCGFTKDVSVTIDDTVYCIALDSCANIKTNGKYYKITVTDRHIINDIFKEYGAILAEE